MDFDFSPGEQEFRRELVELFEAMLPDWWFAQTYAYNRNQKAFELTLQVCEAMAEKGWLTSHWPVQYGGRDASVWEQIVMREETWVRGEPRGQQYMSTNWIGPAIMAFGTEEQKQTHLRAISEGRALWCQGFSEPQAGSDLGALRLAAVREADEYVLDGEKIWTSHTPHAEWCFLLARSHPDAPKHKGISVFLVPMDTPGISVHPIESLTGFGEFASVRFEGVRVPDSALLGAENEGWATAMAALGFERLGAPRYVSTFKQLEMLVEYCTRTRRNGKLLAQDGQVRSALAEVRTEAEVARLLYYRGASALARDEDPGVFGSLQRIATTRSCQKVADVAYEILGPEAQKWGASFVDGLGEQWLESIKPTISAGTVEMQFNAAATRGLRLPRS